MCVVNRGSLPKMPKSGTQSTNLPQMICRFSLRKSQSDFGVMSNCVLLSLIATSAEHWSRYGINQAVCYPLFFAGCIYTYVICIYMHACFFFAQV